jgi:hypothetical protein
VLPAEAQCQRRAKPDNEAASNQAQIHNVNLNSYSYKSSRNASQNPTGHRFLAPLRILAFARQPFLRSGVELLARKH